jgi:transcriptional regulator with XRE-family HTH domain
MRRNVRFNECVVNIMDSDVAMNAAEQVEAVVYGFAEKLRRTRQEREVSLVDLARRSGVARTTLSNLEAGNGNPTIETLAAIAAGLAVPLGDLLVLQETPASAQELVVRSGRQTSPVQQEVRDRLPAGVLSEIWLLRLATQEPLVRGAHAPGTFEYITVGAGSLRCGPVGKEVDLEPGDFCRFAGDTTHVYQALTDEPMAATVVMSYRPPTSSPVPF